MRLITKIVAGAGLAALALLIPSAGHAATYPAAPAAMDQGSSPGICTAPSEVHNEPSADSEVVDLCQADDAVTAYCVANDGSDVWVKISLERTGSTGFVSDQALTLDDWRALGVCA